MYVPAVVLLTLLSAESCLSARILALIPFPARSHWIVMEPLFQELAARGHQVTVFSSFPKRKQIANYTEVDFSHLLPPMISEFSVEMIREKMPNSWTVTKVMHELHDEACEKFMKEVKSRKLLSGKYDLVFTEIFGSDYTAYFAHKFDVPIISMTTSMALPWGADRFGLPDSPAYIPNYLVNFTPKMNLWERTYNAIVLLYAKFMHQYFYRPRVRVFMEEFFGHPLPDLQEVLTNRSSLLFLNSYHTLSQSRPFPPNVVEIGGIHIKKQPQPLPEFQEFLPILDNATDGAVVMSFGSLVRSASIPKRIIMMFMNAFAKCKQTFIFKFEEPLPEAPPNVIVRKWLPQGDVVEHKNVVAIIAHGGLASTIEAVHFGKPLIGVPFFADQGVNVMSIVRRGAGVMLDLDTLTEEKISTALSQVINNPKYSENMRSLSTKFRDRPMTPLQSAVYWTEYVLRHNGAPHLRPASVHLPWYQHLLVDVVLVFLSALAAVLAALYFTLRWSLCKILRQPTKIIKSSKKKN